MSPLVGSDSRSFCASSASSLASAALVSSTVCMRELRLEFFFPFDIVLNDGKNYDWVFVLIQEELDKGLFVARAL